MKIPWRRSLRETAAEEVLVSLRFAQRSAEASTGRIDRAIEKYRWMTELAAAEERIREKADK